MFCVAAVLAEFTTQKCWVDSMAWKFYCQKYYRSRLIDIGDILLSSLSQRFYSVT